MAWIRYLQDSSVFHLLFKVVVETLVAALAYRSVYTSVARFLDPSVVFTQIPSTSVSHFPFLIYAYIVSGYWLFLVVLLLLLRLFFPQRAATVGILLALGGGLYIGSSIFFGEANVTTFSVATSTLVGSGAVLIAHALFSLSRNV